MEINVEVKKRSDGKYNVWQYFSAWAGIALYKIRGIFYQYFEDIDFNHATMESVVNKSIGRWIVVEVLQNKRAATEYCKKHWGRQCFKEKEGMSITYV